MRRLMADAVPLFDVRAAADFSYRVGEIIGDGWLALGDASGFVDPLFSTGVHLALRGASIAAPLIDRALADVRAKAADDESANHRERIFADGERAQTCRRQRRRRQQ